MTKLPDQAGKILGPLSGVATTWALDLGLRLGVFEHLAGRPEGAGADEVAEALGLDPLYTKVVLRAAYAGEVLDLDDGRYRLAEHMQTLLLDPDSPAYAAGAVQTLVALRETFLDLRRFARTGEREWWSDFDPEWIDAVGENGQTYYRRSWAPWCRSCHRSRPRWSVARATWTSPAVYAAVPPRWSPRSRTRM